MRGRLLLLNLALLAACLGVGSRLRAQREEHQRRRAEFLSAKVAAPPAPSILLPSPPPQISAASYLEVASRLLFSPDRNPTVIVEVVQPKPVPPLPRFYGAMNFGQGPRVILALPGQSQKSYVAGDKIGDFQLAAIEPAALVFRWEDREIRKSYEELRDKGEPPAPQPSQPGGAPAQPAPQQAVATVATIEAPPEPKGPGAEAGENLRYCQPGDSTPAGAIVNGYRKVVKQSPFGQTCLWEKVQ